MTYIYFGHPLLCQKGDIPIKVLNHVVLVIDLTNNLDVYELKGESSRVNVPRYFLLSLDTKIVRGVHSYGSVYHLYDIMWFKDYFCISYIP